MKQENRPELAELLGQAGWLRSLARSLVADPHEAEEVEQDAWVVALQRREAVRVDLASWLRSVVRHLALRRAGRERRRPAVEGRAARPEAGGETAGEVRDAVERMELQRWLAEALLALDEPYRSAVILRHVEGLDPAAIAERQGCSREAARQRVARGLARLRSALDTEHGGRERWCLVLAPLVTRPGAHPFVPLASGGLLVGSKILLGSLVAAAAVAFLWLAIGRDGAGPPRARASTGEVPAEVALESPAETRRAPPPGAGAGREVLAPAGEAAPESPTPPANPLFALLTGRVLDEVRAPVPGAEVVVRRPEAGHFSMLDLEVRRNPRETARGTTDAEGRFAFELERGIPFDLAVEAGELGDEVVRGRYAGEELEVVLVRGWLVHGTVTRERDGAPIAGARVRVFQVNHRGGSERATTTAGDGSYRLRLGFTEDATLEVTPRREQGSGWIELEFGAERELRRDVALPDGIEVRGHVRVAGSGEPIEGAEVGEGWTFRRSALTDANGEYALEGFGVADVPELFARAAGFGKRQRADLPAAVDGVMRVDFELPRGRRARGRVLDAGRRPLAGAYVGAVASEFGPQGQHTDWISGRTDAAGRFELEGLAPDLPHCLLASAEGWATQVYDFPADEPRLDEVDLGDVVLSPPAVLAGVVHDEAGAPVGGAEVLLEGANRDRGRLRGDGAQETAGDWYVDSRVALADARGRFWFGALPAGDFSLYARRGGRPPGPRVALALDEGELRVGFVLPYPGGEAIRGTVVDAEGNGLGGVYVNARLSAARGGAEVDRGLAQASKRTGPDGVFELSGLPPGTYRLDLHPFELASDPDTPWLSTQVLAVETGAEPLRIVLPRGLSIRGRLVDAAGAALVGYSILGNPVAGEGSAFGASGDDGTFMLEVAPGTVWDLEVRGAPQTDAWERVYHTEPGVPAGTRELVLRVDLAAPAGGERPPGEPRRK